MFANIQFCRLLVLTIALQFVISCQPKSRQRDNKKVPANQEQKEQTDQTQNKLTTSTAESPKSDQSVSNVIGAADEKQQSDQQTKQDEQEKNQKATKDDKKSDGAAKVGSESVENKGKDKDDPSNENKNLFMSIAADLQKCQSSGIQVIRFQDNEKTTLVVSQLVSAKPENDKTQFSVIRLNDKNQIQSVVVSDSEKSTKNSLYLLDAHLNIEYSRPKEVRLAITGQQNELVGQIDQLSKDDQISKHICGKLELNPLSIVLQSEILTFTKELKAKKIELSGTLSSQDQVFIEVKLQLLKELKAIVQIAHWAQQFDYTFTNKDSSLVDISGFGQILVSENQLELKLTKGLRINKTAIPTLSRPSFVDSKAKDDNQLVFQENQASALVFKYIE